MQHLKDKNEERAKTNRIVHIHLQISESWHPHHSRSEYVPLQHLKFPSFFMSEKLEEAGN